MGECEVYMTSEVVYEFKSNYSLCINFNEVVNGEEYENSVMNIQDEKQVVNEDLHSIMDCIEEYPPLLGRGVLVSPGKLVVEHGRNTRTRLDAVKKPCLHVKAKVKEEKLEISIVSLHKSVQTLKQELDILKANVLKA